MITTVSPVSITYTVAEIFPYEENYKIHNTVLSAVVIKVHSIPRLIDFVTGGCSIDPFTHFGPLYWGTETPVQDAQFGAFQSGIN